jgi:1-acyl-sn-glycerol-3-phosphate acyltransferase
MSDWKLKPARDIGLAPGERLRSLARERGLVGLAVNGLWRRLLRSYLGTMHRLEVVGREKLPPPPFVIIANHASHLDALVLAASLRGEAARSAHALAAGELFFGSGAIAAFSSYAISAFPIWRGRTKRGELKLLRERLAEDRLVYIMFPEGTRSRTGEMAPFQQGMATLVAGSGVPVVPCRIEGAHEAWPPQAKWPRPGRLRLTIGVPIATEELDRAALTATAEAAVRAL